MLRANERTHPAVLPVALGREKMRIWKYALGLAALAGAFLAGPATVRAESFDLGTASNLTVLGLNGTDLDLSLVTINGNVGVGPSGNLNVMQPSKIIGTAFVDPTA